MPENLEPLEAKKEVFIAPPKTYHIPANTIEKLSDKWKFMRQTEQRASAALLGQIIYDLSLDEPGILDYHNVVRKSVELEPIN